jgi:hypothetical protein
MNKTIKKASLIGTLSIAALGVMSASAMGWGGMGMANLTPEELATKHTTMFQQQATLLGISLADVKAAWASGKDLKTLAKEKGISETDLQAKMKTAREAQMKEHLQALVSKGVITQAQADQRLTYMQSNTKAGKGGKGGRGEHKGMGMGMMGF